MSEEITELPEKIEWRRHAVFLDFDGTLTPIVARPDDVVLAGQTRQALERLCELTDGALAILSGRALADLRARLFPSTCAMSGSHGLEISPAEQAGSAAEEARALLQPVLRQVTLFAEQNGLMVEDKPGAVTIHYRNKPALAAASQALINEIAGANPALRSMHGDMVSEVALAGVDKGRALARFMESAPFRGRVPIMAGDDVTDEDAFRAARTLDGFGIKIGSGQTAARYRAADTQAFLTWLWRLTDRAAC